MAIAEKTACFGHEVPWFSRCIVLALQQFTYGRCKLCVILEGRNNSRAIVLRLRNNTKFAVNKPCMKVRGSRYAVSLEFLLVCVLTRRLFGTDLELDSFGP